MADRAAQVWDPSVHNYVQNYGVMQLEMGESLDAQRPASLSDAAAMH